jgi:hypothetical protein
VVQQVTRERRVGGRAGVAAHSRAPCHPVPLAGSRFRLISKQNALSLCRSVPSSPPSIRIFRIFGILLAPTMAEK